MSRIIKWVCVAAIILLVITGWKVLGNGTAFAEKSRYFIIPEGKTGRQQVMEVLEKEEIISGSSLFRILGSQLGIWNKIKPGKYEVKKGESLLGIARMLRNGKQANINLVINRLRLKEDFAKLVSKNFSTDSVAVMHYLNSTAMMNSFAVDTANVFTLIIPDTYTFYWNTPIDKIMQRLYTAQKTFWSKNGRLAKAEKTGLTPQQVYILASIVDEETNYESDKYKIASVYINRLNKQMPLQACPTIKYAMKDFTLTRIYEKYLFNPSPYNTYRKKGLPPGPICTPSPKTIDIVLDAPATDYLFFVAKSDFSGYHHFSSSFQEHSQYAKEYQKALDIYMAKKAQKENQQ